MNKLMIIYTMKLETILKLVLFQNLSELYNAKDDNIIFEVSTSQMPAYRPLKPLDDNCNTTRKENFNDYYIDGEDNSKVENIYKEEKYTASDCQKELQNDPPYNKFMHIKQ